MVMVELGGTLPPSDGELMVEAGAAVSDEEVAAAKPDCRVEG
jgi:hypothetical protein